MRATIWVSIQYDPEAKMASKTLGLSNTGKKSNAIVFFVYKKSFITHYVVSAYYALI